MRWLYMAISEEDKTTLKLLKLQHALKEVAMPVGSLHSYWDIISDIQCYIEGKEGIIKEPTELIKMAEEALNLR